MFLDCELDQLLLPCESLELVLGVLKHRVVFSEFALIEPRLSSVHFFASSRCFTAWSETSSFFNDLTLSIFTNFRLTLCLLPMRAKAFSRAAFSSADATSIVKGCHRR